MGRIATRQRDKCRAKSPTFIFSNRALKGIPERDSEAERAAKDKLVQEFMEKKGKR